jgi:hypothetical protein
MSAREERSATAREGKRHDQHGIHEALFGTGEVREATKKGARAYDELAARRKASTQKVGARCVAGVTKSPKAESRKPKAESRKPKAESRKPKAESRKPNAGDSNRRSRER